MRGNDPWKVGNEEKGQNKEKEEKGEEEKKEREARKVTGEVGEVCSTGTQTQGRGGSFRRQKRER